MCIGGLNKARIPASGEAHQLYRGGGYGLLGQGNLVGLKKPWVGMEGPLVKILGERARRLLAQVVQA